MKAFSGSLWAEICVRSVIVEVTCDGCCLVPIECIECEVQYAPAAQGVQELEIRENHKADFALTS